MKKLFLRHSVKMPSGQGGGIASVKFFCVGCVRLSIVNRPGATGSSTEDFLYIREWLRNLKGAIF